MNITKRAIITFIISIWFAGLATAQNCANGQGGVGACAQAFVEHLALLPIDDFDAEEIAAISFLREEEKLARDVYVVLSLSWDTPVFGRIARSEQRHMDLVAMLLARHELTDPVADDTIGAFSDPDLAELYDELTTLGQQSFADALMVGATIEDLDLADLAALRELSDELDVWLIVENLAAGSRNHLRAFTTALANNGLTYEAQYLDPWVMDEILAAEAERGVVYDEFGEVLAACGAQGAQNSPGSRSGGNRANADHASNGSNDGNRHGDGSGDCDGTGPNGGGN